MTATRLQLIVESHRERAAQDQRSLTTLVEQAKATPVPRDFAAALRAPGLGVISEIKRRSPSAGELNTTLDPVTLAAEYERGGAACLSVLTDGAFFGGSPTDLQQARSTVTIPALRKDFTVDPRDIADARIMGADAILLIVAALDDEELQTFHDLATELELTALVEIHDTDELARAKRISGLRVLGVNQRNLHTFEITGEAMALREHFPDDVVAVAESGIATLEDAQRMASAAYDAILVGTALVTAGSPYDAVRAFSSIGA